MKWHILNDKGTIIASFGDEADRDVCFDAFIDYWGIECEFETRDD